MPKLIILGLGVFERQLTEEAAVALQCGGRIILQTERCYAADWLNRRHIAWTSVDSLYANSVNFDELNQLIVNFVFQCDDDQIVIYAVPGNAADLPVSAYLARQAQCKGFSVDMLTGISYAQTAIAAGAVGKEGFEGAFQQGYAIQLWNFDTTSPLCIQELDSKLLAGQCKLALLEYYPPQLTVYLTVTEGERYCVHSLPLHEIDRKTEDMYAHTTCLLVPAVQFEKLERYGPEELKKLMERLRAPGGCPWDQEQTHQSIRANILEEAYEVVEAIDANDLNMLQEELGDLLMQVYFHAVIAQEHGQFSIRDVCTELCTKLIFRHPHVFKELKVNNAEDVRNNWDDLKRIEKKQDRFSDMLLAVPKPLPALKRAQKLQSKAAKAGFDWEDAMQAMEKVEEEQREFMVEWNDHKMGKENDERLSLELGDWLFSVVNVARLCCVDPEMALMGTNDKFLRRFISMEELAEKDGKELQTCDLKTLDRYWDKAKDEE